MVHVVVRLGSDETAFPHDDARRREVLHPVTPLQLTADLSLHFVAHLAKLQTCPSVLTLWHR